MSPIYEMMMRSTDGLFAINSDQEVVLWNSACEELTGIPAGEAMGSNCHEVLNGRDPHGRRVCRPDCPLSALSRGGPPPATQQLPMRITHASGQVLQLCLGTMLVPSMQTGQWNVVHFMRRGREARTEEQSMDADSIAAAARGRNAGHSRGPTSQSGLSLLTSREREILQLLARGAAISIMSDRLHISAATVRNHIQRLMAKLDVHSRVEAVAYAHHHRLV